MAHPDAGVADSTASTAEPLCTEDALRRLDDEAFVELVSDFWERRGWTVETVGDPGTWYVDLYLHDGWPVEKRALARIKRPDSRRQVSGTDVRHFVRTVQGEEVDRGKLIVPTAVHQSARNQGEQFNVDVVGADDLARRVDHWGDHDLVASHAGLPVTPRRGSAHARAPDTVVRALERADVTGRIERVLDGRLPSDPTADDVARLSFAAFRIAFLFSVVTFVLAVTAGSGSLLSRLLLGLFLFGTYFVLLPLMAVDIYVVRRFEDTEWTPNWWSLASFVLAPVLFAVGTYYWYRRRERTPSGQQAAWHPRGGSDEP